MLPASRDTPIRRAGSTRGAGLDGVPDLEFAQILDPTHSHANQFNGRVDYYFSPKDQFAASVYFTKLDQLGPSGSDGNRPNADIPQKPLNSAATVIYIHTFTPTLLNERGRTSRRFADDQLQDAASIGVNFVRRTSTSRTCRSAATSTAWCRRRLRRASSSRTRTRCGTR